MSVHESKLPGDDPKGRVFLNLLLVDMLDKFQEHCEGDGFGKSFEVASWRETIIKRFTTEQSFGDDTQDDLRAFTLARELQMGIIDNGHIEEAVRTIENQRLLIKQLRRTEQASGRVSYDELRRVADDNELRGWMAASDCFHRRKLLARLLQEFGVEVEAE